ncbi:MAG: ribosome small subunit-dependent GTPase A [Rhodopirellula sp.]|nr:ribosome small subunit-dependent GTPase A [Rhodopirellula sp.]
MNKNSRKVRTQLKKGHQGRQRKGDLTREYREHGFKEGHTLNDERLSGKGELTRHRTVIGTAVSEEHDAIQLQLEIDESRCIRGRVLSVHGLECLVTAEDSKTYRCTVRGLLKNLTTGQRNVVAAGDLVFVRPELTTDAGDLNEGMIVRIEPRYGCISRTSKGQQHVMVANVDQLVIVISVLEPEIKPNLIDRFLVTAEKVGCHPIICFNKVDLIDLAELQPLAGVYGQLGYTILFTSVETGQGISQLKSVVKGKQNVVVGQSGVGKSSLLNRIQPSLNLRTNTVSRDNQKGRHTTTAATLIPLEQGGYIVDTPGIRQFQLWDVIAEEVAGFFRDIRPFVNNCKFPDCTHLHEFPCGVKQAVADGLLDLRRYESYCQIQTDL